MDPLFARALAVFGAAVAICGSSISIGWIGSRAMDAIARQPEEAKNIRANMILAAALVEGLGFFGAIIALLVVFL